MDRPATPKNVAFALDPQFVASYASRDSPFGFAGLGELVYRRTYSRVKKDGTKERWHDTIERVVNGTYNMQRKWVQKCGLEWRDPKAQKSAQEMFDRIFHLKFTPPGRGLWAMGSPLTEDKKLFAALNNCAFVSTDQIARHPSKCFTFLMDAAMLGIGVGFDVEGAGKITVCGPDFDLPVWVYKIQDSREGWVESVKRLIESYLVKARGRVEFDYSAIRAAGLPIKNFGGTSSGPGALKDLHVNIRGILDPEIGKPISITAIVDIMNLIGVCVVSGNVRRTAEIVFGDPALPEYVNLKNYAVNPQRAAHGWTSNNSVKAPIGMDYRIISERINDNGEPGALWLENVRNYSRMNGVIDNKDHRAKGANPCVPANTWIKTAEGLRQVQDLIGKPFTAMVEGKGYLVEKGFFQTNYLKLIEVHLEGARSVKLTEHHKILCAGDRWVPARDLKPGHKVALDGGYIGIVDEVKKVEGDSVHVYDCTVPIVSRYVTGDGIVLHNCNEQTLESFELCCLVETFPNRHEDLKDFLRTLKFAYMYAKTVTLGKTHWPETNAVMLHNRRIGCSMSGLAQFVAAHGIEEMRIWCEAGFQEVDKYDEIYSRWFAIPRSIKMTSIKPSGTVSLLAGATPGLHYPIARLYIRRVRIPADSDLIEPLREAGLHVEPEKKAQGDGTYIDNLNTSVVSFPIDAGINMRAAKDVSMWEQLALAAFFQKHWADNQVSATVTFDKVSEGPQIPYALDIFQYQLKGVSFLPNDTHGYVQAPYEAITKEQYEEMSARIKSVNYDSVAPVDPAAELFCDGAACEYQPRKRDCLDNGEAPLGASTANVNLGIL